MEIKESLDRDLVEARDKGQKRSPTWNVLAPSSTQRHSRTNVSRCLRTFFREVKELKVSGPQNKKGTFKKMRGSRYV